VIGECLRAGEIKLEMLVRIEGTPGVPLYRIKVVYARVAGKSWLDLRCSNQVIVASMLFFQSTIAVVGPSRTTDYTLEITHYRRSLRDPTAQPVSAAQLGAAPLCGLALLVEI
jgi:hypothetical protein